MTPGADLRISRTTQRALGAFLLLHFVVVCAVKVFSARAGEIFWMSHIGLLLAAVGLLAGRSLLVAVALVDILVLHGLWLADCLTWCFTGVFPLGITRYLAQANAWTWIATAHHFYLVPLLLAVVRRRAVRTPEALLGAVAVYFALTVLSRALTSPELNVNFSFGVPVAQAVPLIAWGNTLPGAIYLPLLNAFVAFVMLTPAFILLRHRAPASIYGDARADRTPSASSPGSSAGGR